MKNFFHVAVTFLVAAFVSCSENNDDFTAPVAGSDLPAICFDIGNGRVSIEQQKAPATRGKGAVGDITGSRNLWNGEELKVYMFKKGTLDLALGKTGDGLTPLFDNVSIIATAGADVVESSTQKYYPMQDNFDFFAYYVDDAASGVDVVKGTDIFTIPVTIDGSQDLMVAKAEPTADQMDLLPAAKADDFYSAYSARNGINPHFKFKHLLTRFAFEVKAAAVVEESVVIKSVEIINAKTTADMVVAYANAPTELLKNQSTPATVYLKDANGAALAETTPSVAGFNRIGESLLLMPQAEYNIVIRMAQTVNGKEERFNYSYKLNPASHGLVAFEAGKQYNVKFTVHGLSKIEFEFKLTDWEDAGNLDVEDN